MAKLKKDDMIQAISGKLDNKVSKKDTEAVFNATFAFIAEQLAAGNSVPVLGFGTFSTKHHEARSGRNPQTKETVTIAARTVPAFKASASLKEAVVNTQPQD